MLIGIEASRADKPAKTGVEWYAWHLIQGLKQAPGQEAHSWMLYSNQAVSAQLAEAPANWHMRSLSWPSRYLWTQVRLSWELSRHRPDVLFVPAHVLPRVIPDKSVVTLHDVGFLRYPHLYKRVQRIWHPLVTRDIARRASRILTVSEYSKQEIVHYCNVDPERITVTYPGADHLSTEEITTEQIRMVIERYRISGHYFLYIGRVEAKKNILTLIEAFRRYKEDRGLGDPQRLVLAGIPGEGFGEIQQAIQHSGMGEAILQIGYIAQEDKRALLAGATALIHPSWYEGFGFTPLEAMASSCPVICSRTSSLPEVVGLENALWFEPSDPEALAVAMDQMVQEPLLQDTLRQQGKNWVKRYRWQDTARITLETLTHWSGTGRPGRLFVG